MLVAKLLILRD